MQKEIHIKKSFFSFKFISKQNIILKLKLKMCLSLMENLNLIKK